MKLNKVLGSSALFALTATAWVGFGASDASAAITPANDITFDGPAQTLIIKNVSSEKEVLFGVAKASTKNGKTVLKVDSWDVYEGTDLSSSAQNGLQIDLSKLSTKKDNYVEVKTLGGEPIVIKIPAGDAASTVTYDPCEDKVEFKSGKSKSDAAAVDYEFRTASGEWTEGKAQSGAAEFVKYQNQGATLYLRKLAYTASTQTNAVKIAAGTDKVCNSDDLETELTVYNAACAMPGKEVKLNITKKANGPKAKVKYSTGVVTIPAKSEYRVLTNNNGTWTVPTAVEKNEAKKDFEAKTLLTANNITVDKGVLEIRTAANTSGKKKKASSKWTRIELENPSALSDNELAKISSATGSNASDPNYVNELNGDDTNGWYASADSSNKVSTTNGGTVKYGGKGIANAVITNGKTDNTKETLVTAKYGTVAKDNTGSVILENKGDTVYQVVVADKYDATSFTGAKVYTLKGKNSLTIKKLKTKQWIYIRKAGVDKTQTWVGVYKVMGVVDLPMTKVVEKKEASSN